MSEHPGRAETETDYLPLGAAAPSVWVVPASRHLLGLRWLRAQALPPSGLFLRVSTRVLKLLLDSVFLPGTWGPHPEQATARDSPLPPASSCFPCFLCLYHWHLLPCLAPLPSWNAHRACPGEKRSVWPSTHSWPRAEARGHTSVLRLHPPLSSLLHCVSMAASTEDPCLLCHITLETESHSLGALGDGGEAQRDELTPAPGQPALTPEQVDGSRLGMPP